MSKKDVKERIVIDEGKEFVRHTIVGGRPSMRKKVRLNVPIGIEKILYRAAINPAFKAGLLEDRAGTLEAHGMKLTASETAILGSIPDGTLDLMIGNINPERQGKRRFMKMIAAAVVTIASGTAAATLGGCESKPEPGDIEVTDTPGDIDVDQMVIGGEMPDIPQVEDADAPGDIDVDEMVVGGDMPDIPDREDVTIESDMADVEAGDSSEQKPDADDDTQEGEEEEGAD